MPLSCRHGRRGRPRETLWISRNYTDRARGFVQSAQSLGAARGPSAIRSRSICSRCCSTTPKGLASRPDRPRRRPLARGARGGRGRARQAAEGVRQRRRPGLSGAGARARLRSGAEGRGKGRRQLRHRRAPPAGARAREGQRGRKDSGRAPASRRRTSTPPSTRLRKGRTADTSSAENAYDALKKYARDLTAGGARRQDRPGDRPRRGDPPHHPGALAPHQEQPGADRRARRRQDRASSRVWRSASSTATCRRACTTRSCWRSTWAR